MSLENFESTETYSTNETKKQLSQVLSWIDEKKQIEDKIKKTKSALTRIRIVSMILDRFWVDAIVGFIPLLGDHGPAILASIYFLIEAKKAGLEKKDIIKILSLQWIDDLLWSIPVAWNIADFLFQSNKWAEKIFQTRLKELKTQSKKLENSNQHSTTKTAIKEFLNRKIF